MDHRQADLFADFGLAGADRFNILPMPRFVKGRRVACAAPDPNITGGMWAEYLVTSARFAKIAQTDPYKAKALLRTKGCGRLYWKGSHYQRMVGLIERMIDSVNRAALENFDH